MLCRNLGKGGPALRTGIAALLVCSALVLLRSKYERGGQHEIQASLRRGSSTKRPSLQTLSSLPFNTGQVSLNTPPVAVSPPAPNAQYLSNPRVHSQAELPLATTKSSKPGFLSKLFGGSDGGNKKGKGLFAMLAAAGGLGLIRALPAGAESSRKGDMPPKVLILLSDTGGGHRASARALVDAFNVLRPGQVQVEIVDVWTAHAPPPFNNFVKNYQYLAQRPLQWRMLYGFGRWGPFRRGSNEWTNWACNKPFRKMIQASNPDLIVSVHPLCQFVPLRVIRRLGREDKKVPFVTVVTDLASAHPTWFHRDVDRCFVATDELAQMARYHGVGRDKIRVHGLPIRPEFWSSVDGEENGKPGIRKDLGLPRPDLPTVLVVGGGDGVGGIANVAKAIGESLANGKPETEGSGFGQMIVVCGKNQDAKNELEKHDWKGVPVRVEGFSDQMSRLMAASDCIVTKAGPGTITEAMIRGLPIMLSSYLPGQERGNVDYVVQGGFGAFSRKPDAIARTVSSWLQDKDLLGRMSERAKAEANSQATFEIAREILEMLPDHNTIPRSSKAAVPAGAER
mmetsp:Transcript_13077/g.32037  ORF Transcript_13077/g.32037 Transcript_13077/m.32037 type:complete len:567 (-) Transcript_13077:74-1774(-)